MLNCRVTLPSPPLPNSARVWSCVLSGWHLCVGLIEKHHILKLWHEVI